MALRQQGFDKTTRLIEVCKIRAPVDGTVFHNYIGSHEGQEKVKEGMEVRPWHRLVSLPDTSRVLLRVQIEETRIAELKKENPAVITLQSIKGETFVGKVYSIDPVAKARSEQAASPDEAKREALGTKVFDVLVSISGPDERITTGLSGEAQIATMQLKNVLTVPPEAVYRVGDETVVYVAEGDQIKARSVKVGPEAENRTVIESGLSEGQEVYLTLPSWYEPEGRQ